MTRLATLTTPALDEGVSELGALLARPLAALGIDGFLQPGWLAVGMIALALALWLEIRRAPAAVPWPGLAEARAAGARSWEPVRIAALLLRAVALGCLAGVLAGPVSLRRPPPEPGLGLDLVLVLDTSGSMASLDTRSAGRTRTRLDLAREVVGRFARERAAEGDRVGLVVFGEAAFTQCPITHDGALLSSALERTRVGMAGESTALGDALALAVKRVRGSAGKGGPGRVVVLLTDGRNNAGAIPVDLAAELAVRGGVRVHTVGIGVGGDEVPVATRSSAPGAGLRFERHDPDLESLERLARATGGRFHHARRAADLSAVYEEIDALERVPRPLPPRLRSAPRAEPLLAAAGGCLLAELLLARVWRRRVP
ncbi:MAG: VWA domain-containing protein [Myxococcota bacterium]